MKNASIFPDSCVWIDYFRDRDFSHGDVLNNLITEDRIFICGIIISELISGAKSSKEIHLIESTMDSLNFIEMDYQIFVNAGKKRNHLLSRGITVPLTDILIAECCIKNNLVLMTKDKHFNDIGKMFKLNLKLI